MASLHNQPVWKEVLAVGSWSVMAPPENQHLYLALSCLYIESSSPEPCVGCLSTLDRLGFGLGFRWEVFLQSLMNGCLCKPEWEGLI